MHIKVQGSGLVNIAHIDGFIVGETSQRLGGEGRGLRRHVGTNEAFILPLANSGSSFRFRTVSVSP
jgi:hypothetical protein